MQSEEQDTIAPEEREDGDRGSSESVIEPSLKPTLSSDTESSDADAADPDFSIQNPPVQAVEEFTETIGEPASGQKANKPLFDASGGTAWAGVLIALALIFGLTFLMMRGRARRQARINAAEEEGFFQPAGEDAEITFDDSQEAFNLSSNDEHENIDTSDSKEFENETLEDIEFEDEPVKKNGLPFGNLFSRKKKEPDQIEDAADPAIYLDDEEEVSIVINTEESEDIVEETFADEEYATVKIEKSPPEEEYMPFQPMRDSFEERRRLEDEARKVEAEARRAEAEARRAAEEERLRSQTALEERERRVRDDERRLSERLEAVSKRTPIDTPIETPKSEVAKPVGLFKNDPDYAVSANDDGVNSTLIDIEEALLAQSEAMKAETRNLLESFANRFEKRLDDVTRAVEARDVNQLAAYDSTENSNQVTDLVEIMSRRLDDHRVSVDTAINKLFVRVENIDPTGDTGELRSELSALRGALGSHHRSPLAPVVQLNDILRNALPPNAYELNAVLGNNRKTDCLVILPHPPGPIAIDARFPVEVFDEFNKNLSIDQERAESEFRRSVLRHIVDIAERQIIPDQTADSAMMFIPSETMYAELHARFPDVVQDGYRARVWIVSPTTLMATLHTMRAVLQDAKSRENAEIIQDEAREVMGEVAELRDRVTGLEENFDRARDEVRGLVSSTNQVYRRAETISQSTTTSDDTLPDVRSQPVISQPSTPHSSENDVRPLRPTLATVQTLPADTGEPTSKSASARVSPFKKYEEGQEDDTADRPSFPLR